MQDETIADPAVLSRPVQRPVEMPVRSDVLVSLFDLVDYPVIVVDLTGALVWSNLPGRQILADGKSLQLRHNQVVPAHDAYLAKWQQKIFIASQGEESLICLNDGRFGQAIAINALAGEYLAIILGKSYPCTPQTLNRFARSFKITHAEQRVVALLMAGESPGDIALANSVAEATIRTQIKSVLAKTGIASIRDLLLALSRLPPVKVARESY